MTQNVQREGQRKNRIEWARRAKEEKLREVSEKRQHDLLLQKEEMNLDR